jgi:hypothetical protein
MSNNNKLNLILNKNTHEDCIETIFKIKENYNQLIINTDIDFNLKVETYFENIDEVYQKINPNFVR